MSCTSCAVCSCPQARRPTLFFLRVRALGGQKSTRCSRARQCRAFNQISPGSVSAFSVRCAWTSHGSDLLAAAASQMRLINEAVLGILLRTQQVQADTRAARAAGDGGEELGDDHGVVSVGLNFISCGRQVGDPLRAASALQAGSQGLLTLTELRVADPVNTVAVEFLVDRLYSENDVARADALQLTAKDAYSMITSCYGAAGGACCGACGGAACARLCARARSLPRSLEPAARACVRRRRVPPRAHSCQWWRERAAGGGALPRSSADGSRAALAAQCQCGGGCVCGAPFTSRFLLVRSPFLPHALPQPPRTGARRRVRPRTAKPSGRLPVSSPSASSKRRRPPEVVCGRPLALPAAQWGGCAACLSPPPSCSTFSQPTSAPPARARPPR